MTVLENLEMGAYVRGKPDPADLDRVFGLFPRLKERETQMAGTMSGGEQQMLAIGRALMARPTVLLLDEPSWGWRRSWSTDLPDHRRDQPAGHDGAAGGAERADGAGVAERGYVIQTGEIVLADTGASCSGTRWCARRILARSERAATANRCHAETTFRCHSEPAGEESRCSWTGAACGPRCFTPFSMTPGV